MAKLAFSKLGLKFNNEITNIMVNDAIIEVKNYLPVNSKLELVSNVINATADDNGFYNEGKLKVYFTLEVIYAYTNLSFTDKQKEDPCKLYDLFTTNEVWQKLWDVIPASEKEFLTTCLYKSIESIYAYKNSAVGILENITNDYNDLKLDAQELQQTIGDPNNMSFLREVLTKLG